jgi:predicted nucleic acid-binding protein
VSTVYIETSAVLTWLLGESRADEVVSLVNGAKTMVTSVLTLLEAERGLIRVERQKMLTAAECQKLRGLIVRAKNAWVLMELSEEVRDLASRRFPVEPLRTLGAIHLATALVFLKAYSDLQMLSYDHRILDNLKSLGLTPLGRNLTK